MKRYLIFFLLCWLQTFALLADDLVLLPRPQQLLTLTDGFFNGDEATDISVEIAEAFRIKVGYDYGLTNTYENDRQDGEAECPKLLHGLHVLK